MSPILNKAQMTEEDVKLQFITPAITAKWTKDMITMETRITDGKINLKGNLVVREKEGKLIYLIVCFLFPLLLSNVASLPKWKNSCRCVRE